MTEANSSTPFADLVGAKDMRSLSFPGFGFGITSIGRMFVVGAMDNFDDNVESW